MSAVGRTSLAGSPSARAAGAAQSAQLNTAAATRITRSRCAATMVVILAAKAPRRCRGDELSTYDRRMGAVSTARGWWAALKRRPRLLRSIEIALAVIALGLAGVALATQWRRAAPTLEDADYWYFGLALAVVAAYYLVFILGWIRILATWDVNVPYRAALQSEMISMIAKYIPGGVWTPASRVAALERLTGETNTAAILASIFVEAILSAVSGIVVFVVSLAWVKDVHAPLAPLILFAVACALLVHPRIFRPLSAKLLKPFGVPELEPLPFPTMVGLLLFYCGTWLISGFALYFMILSVHANPGVATIAFLGGVAAVGAIVAVLVVFAPGGIGVREASMVGLLVAVISTPEAVSVVVLNRLAITLVEIALFFVGVLLWRLRPPSRHPVRELVRDPQERGPKLGDEVVESHH
jgi:glycosyltransferase 2 family protein